MITKDDLTLLSVTHYGVTASFATSETDIETMFALFKAALIAMTYSQVTIDDEILRMAEELNNSK